jgi:uncharacterized protein (UPF0210 family)
MIGSRPGRAHVIPWHSLRDCAHPEIQKLRQGLRQDLPLRPLLVQVARDIEAEFGIPIVNKRVA